MTSILAKCRSWAFKASSKGRCWIFRTRSSNHLSKSYIFINMFCFWLSVLVVFSMDHQHFIVLRNPSTAQDRWSAGLVQILHLTPVQSQRKIIHSPREKENPNCSYHHTITHICTLKSAPRMYALKIASCHILGIPEPIKAIYVPSSLCLLVFFTMGLPKVSYSDNFSIASTLRANKDAGTWKARDWTHLVVRSSCTENIAHPKTGRTVEHIQDHLKSPGHEGFLWQRRHGLAYHSFTQNSKA